LVGRVVTDRAVMAPDEVGALRRTIHVPDEIRVWAEARVV
jgi:hypothetical protein